MTATFITHCIWCGIPVRLNGYASGHVCHACRPHVPGYLARSGLEAEVQAIETGQAPLPELPPPPKAEKGRIFVDRVPTPETVREHVIQSHHARFMAYRRAQEQAGVRGLPRPPTPPLLPMPPPGSVAPPSAAREGGSGKAALLVLCSVVALGARYCDDIMRLRVFRGLTQADGMVDDGLRSISHGARLHPPGGAASSASFVTDAASGTRWLVDAVDAADHMYQVGELLLPEDAAPPDLPVTTFAGRTEALEWAVLAPSLWECTPVADVDHLACQFTYNHREATPERAEGILILREGLLCRVILALPDATSSDGARKLEHRNAAPCERVKPQGNGAFRLEGLMQSYLVRVE